MVINVVSVQHNGGVLPDIILLTDAVSIGEPFNGIRSFRPYRQCSHLNLPTFFPPRVDAQKV